MCRIRDAPITTNGAGYYFSKKVVYKLHTAGQQSDKEHSSQASRVKMDLSGFCPPSSDSIQLVSV